MRGRVVVLQERERVDRSWLAWEWLWERRVVWWVFWDWRLVCSVGLRWWWLVERSLCSSRYGGFEVARFGCGWGYGLGWVAGVLLDFTMRRSFCFHYIYPHLFFLSVVALHFLAYRVNVIVKKLS